MSTVWLNIASIRKYIREEGNTDRVIDNVSVKELEGQLQCEKVVSALFMERTACIVKIGATLDDFE